VSSLSTGLSQLESNVQHLAAGVVFNAVAAELLPGIDDQAPTIVGGGSATGVVAMFGIHRLSKRTESAVSMATPPAW